MPRRTRAATERDDRDAQHGTSAEGGRDAARRARSHGHANVSRGQGGTVVEAYRLGSGGHSWWSTVHRSDGSIVDTTDLVLDFFDAVRAMNVAGS